VVRTEITKRNGRIEIINLSSSSLSSVSLRRGLNILVSTPGRLCDHIDNTQSLSFKNIQFLVFDEADKYETSRFYSLNILFLGCSTWVLLMQSKRSFKTSQNIVLTIIHFNEFFSQLRQQQVNSIDKTN